MRVMLFLICGIDSTEVPAKQILTKIRWSLKLNVTSGMNNWRNRLNPEYTSYKFDPQTDKT